MLGLRDTDVAAVKKILSSFSEVETASIFGSRAKGNYRQGSDVDLSIKGEGILYSTVLQLSAKLNEETMMPYHFDVVNYNEIENQELKAYIDRVGKEIFSKNEMSILTEPGSKYNKPRLPK